MFFQKCLGRVDDVVNNNKGSHIFFCCIFIYKFLKKKFFGVPVFTSPYLPPPPPKCIDAVDFVL